MTQSFLSRLSSQGVRQTHLLRVLAALFDQAHASFSIDELATRLQQQGLEPHRTTLYRQLHALVEHGVLAEERLSDGIQRYVPVSSEAHHHHFICRVCGYAEDLPADICEPPTDQLTQLLQAAGHRVDDHTFVIEGVCASCVRAGRG